MQNVYQKQDNMLIMDLDLKKLNPIGSNVYLDQSRKNTLKKFNSRVDHRQSLQNLFSSKEYSRQQSSDSEFQERKNQFYKSLASKNQPLLLSSMNSQETQKLKKQQVIEKNEELKRENEKLKKEILDKERSVKKKKEQSYLQEINCLHKVIDNYKKTCKKLNLELDSQQTEIMKLSQIIENQKMQIQRLSQVRESQLNKESFQKNQQQKLLKSSKSEANFFYKPTDLLSDKDISFNSLLKQSWQRDYICTPNLPYSVDLVTSRDRPKMLKRDYETEQIIELNNNERYIGKNFFQLYYKKSQLKYWIKQKPQIFRCRF